MNKIISRQDGVVTLAANKGMTIKVSESDFDSIRQQHWTVDVQGYAMSWVRDEIGVRRHVKLHKVLIPEAKCIDHKNGDKLDNTRNNIRECSQAENLANQRVRKTKLSSYKGVAYIEWWNKSKTKCYTYWVAKIAVMKKRIYIGAFQTETEAADAYDAAALRYYGEFARLNMTK